MEKENKKKKVNKAVFIMGSIALAAAAMYVVPIIIESSSSYVYKKSPSKINNDNVWGNDPVKII